ncbi:hypothetical protein LOTGIDRAFT_166239 [Lottia gigantea]|uniref:HELP domain-containing protein n=1 Tax=Lottia gigantea TaxID=225164 RepID=V3Z9P5_LOTGI|nr:hypothetical protein LOTGIDRAFT_166239 [Lottia gigantea]ESO87658.1 hypothetical protein LOTGIDRAFT_166239 [Lottia gigantea]
MADKTAPQSQLKLEWVYGYRGHQCRNNLYYTSNKDVVYFVAGVGIVYSVRDHKQRFFLGHDDDIISLTLHPEKTLVATGQIGKKPYICVWDAATCETVSILKDGHEHGVAAMGFDKEGSRLVSVGLDQHSTINVWDWRKGKILATVRGHSDKVFDVQFHPYMDNTIVSCGVKHIKFWTLCGNALTPKKGIFGKIGEIQTILCLAFGPGNITYSGTLAGDVYVWKDNTLDSVIQGAHNGAIYTLDMCDEGYTTGGKDSMVKLWDTDFKPISAVNLANSQDGYKGLCVRSVCWRADRLLVGTQDSEIFEIDVKDKNKPQCLVQGHAEGELWALAVHPRKPIFATASDDQTLRLWNMTNSELLSKTTLENKIRSCSFDFDGNQIAVGFTDGSFMVLRSRDLSEVIHMKDRKEVIHEMKFSPCGKFLAVASNDNFVDIYSVDQRFKRVGTCSGSSSFITHIDWSEDSKYLQTNSGASERLFFKMPVGKQATNKEEIMSIHWASFTGVLGAEVSGIWEKYTDTNDVNAVDANFAAQTVVTGDDFGLVKLFRFPCLKKGAKFRKYTGHSAHVSNVRFSSDKQKVISIGGADHAIFQWKFYPQGSGSDDLSLGGVDAYLDSNSEASDSDLSDVGELDSDLEREKQVSYDRAIYKEDTKSLKKLMRQDMKAGDKRKKGPIDSLKLSYIHGYRGYDCRNNLFYTQSGEIVYHVAATGIVYSKEKNQQKFYTCHTDDILCLCIHPLKDLVATGQDRSSSYWTGDGKKLVSVGLDDNHTIVVWDWKKGEKLASTRGHKDKIFVVKWNPFDGSKLVSVGVKHIKFWTQTGGGFTSNRGTLGKVAKLCDMLCVAYGKSDDLCFSGGSDGNVFIWQGLNLQKVVKAHEGPVFSMHSLDKGFVTGGKDGVVGLWDDQFDRCLKTYALKRAAIAQGSRGMLIQESPAIRAIVLGHGKILVGTKNGEIIEVDKSGPMTLLTQGHMEGEVWGIDCHPTQAIYATVSDDKTLRLWDLATDHRMLNFKELKQAARCVAFSPDGKALAVGQKDGSFVVVNAESMDDIIHIHHRKEEISDIRFSPDTGKYLAVASHDNFVDIYNVQSTKRVGTCKGASSYITHIDWGSNGKVLMVNSGAKEQLFFEAPRGHRITMKSNDIEKFNWDSWTCVLGTACEGIWPPKSDVTDVNSTTDDFGFVKLFAFPYQQNYYMCCYDSDVEREKKMDYTSKIYISPIREKEGVKPHNQEQAQSTQNKPVASRNVNKAPLVQKADLPPSTGGKRRKITPVNELQLEYVHGYRGFDARSNLYYCNDANDVVFHAAGAGIVQNMSTGSQSFYLEHTDDIICLDVNQHPKFKNVIATGQIGNQPSVHVWDAVTKKTLSIIRGVHSKGVCSVDFSCTGKLLLSVGLEDDHNLAVWRWQDGTYLKSIYMTFVFISEYLNSLTYTGALSGDVYVWKENTLIRLVQKAHTGPVFSMFTTLRDGLIVTGGKELPRSKDNGPVKLWDQDMKRCKAFPIRDEGKRADVVKSVCRSKGKILVGTRDNSVLELSEKEGNIQILVAGHSEGEVWGLDTHPTLNHFITASFDGTVRMWDIAKKTLLARLEVGSARSVAFSPDGELIAVGLNNGEFLVLSVNGLKLWGKKRDRSGAINDVKFSPDNKYLAVGSEDKCVDFYNLTEGPSLNRSSFCKGIPSFVIQMDFSADSKYIRVGTGDYTPHVFKVPAGTLVEDKQILDNITWASWTSVLGEEVIGIWPRDSSNADVNCAHLSHLGSSLATGDDNGFVKLFEFPCSDRYASHKNYVGHSAHVTNVRFSSDDRHLISTGGDDCCVFVWKCV